MKADQKKIDETIRNSEMESLHAPLSRQDISLIIKWHDRRGRIDNGLELSIQSGPNGSQLTFSIKNKSSEEEDYKDLLSAKIYDTFGVTDATLASSAINDCINSMVDLKKFSNLKPNKAKEELESAISRILSLFKELHPKDAYELMMVSKLIILDSMSNKDLINASSTPYLETRGVYQTRAIKLSRLWLEFKEKLDKHRKPDQQITVEHVHINNSGQAIIGSQLHGGGGK
jgi:hypothetical protein